MTSRLGRSAFALCVLLGATARSSAEETVCRRYDAEHENNLLAYNGCMHEQRIDRLKVPTWIGRVANIKDAWSEEGPERRGRPHRHACHAEVYCRGEGNRGATEMKKGHRAPPPP